MSIMTCPRRAPSVAAAAAALFLSGGCASEPTIYLTLADWPVAANRILVQTSVNGKQGLNQYVERAASDPTRFLLHLPAGAEGTVQISLLAQDVAGCIVADRLLSETIPTGLRRWTERTAMLQPTSGGCKSTPSCSPSGWCIQSQGSGQRLRGVWGIGSQDLWVVGESGTILRSKGSAWSMEPAPMGLGGNNLYGIWGVDGTEGWIAGQNGSMVRWRGSALSYESRGGNSLEGAWGPANDNIWVVGEDSRILHWNGTSWSPQPIIGLSASVTLRAVHGIDASHAWAVGGSGVVVRWDGAAWTSQGAIPGSPELQDVWAADASNIWIVGRGGTIFRGDGTTWTRQVSNTPNDLFGIWGSDANNIWAVGPFATIVHWNGTIWDSQVSGIDPGLILFAVWGTDAKNVFAVGDNGTILHHN